MEPIHYVYMAYLLVILSCELYLFYNIYLYFQAHKINELSQEMDKQNNSTNGEKTS